MFQDEFIQLDTVTLNGHVATTGKVRGWVIFVHGSGSSRKSVRNNGVAKKLNDKNFGTFLFDLLTVEEDQVYNNRFNIPVLADRLAQVTKWFMKRPYYNNEPIAFFGASTGAAAALMAVAEEFDHYPLFTVISRGGRPDMAGIQNLHKVSCPVLLLVGSLDHEVITLNQLAQNELREADLVLIPGATHLFEEPGTLDKVVEQSCQWLEQHLPKNLSHEGRASL